MAVSPSIHRLELVKREPPPAGAKEALVRVRACGVRRSHPHVIDRQLPWLRLGLIPGHEITGTIKRKGRDVAGLSLRSTPAAGPATNPT